MMPFSQQDADRILRNSRAFYKGRPKSANKIYPMDKAFAAGDSPLGHKMLKRTLTANEVNKKLGGIRENRSGMTVADYGWHLYMKDVSEGNCTEMNSILASLLRQSGMGSEGSTKMFWMDVNPPGDHNFIVVSSDGSSPAWANINCMRVPTDNFWAIDCWFNVACPTRNYHRLIPEKLAQWASAWK